MISMKDYAKSKNVSYEAIRKQVARYKNELEGHIFKQDRTNFLDEYAIEFLDQKRASNPVIIYEVAKDEEIDRLKKENDSYLKKIAFLQEQLLQQKDQMAALETAKQIAEKEKQLAIAEAVSEANKQAEEVKRIALEERARVLAEQAEIAKNKAVDDAKKEAARVAKEEKDKEYEPVLQELDKAKKELERPLTFMERLTGKRKVGD